MPKLHVEWGERAFDHEANIAIIVDCLSFSSALAVACARGAIVYPFSLRAGAKRFADAMGIPVVGKRNEGTLSLSPPSLDALEQGSQIVLPSPNGANLTLLAKQENVLGGALRNARAVAKAAFATGEDIIIVAAGERWPADNSLRPAFEDWIAAGAIASVLVGEVEFSVEAELAVASFHSIRDDLSSSLRDCISGQELIERGFSVDVDWAAELNATDCVPRLSFEKRTYRDLRLSEADVVDETVLDQRICYYSAV